MTTPSAAAQQQPEILQSALDEDPDLRARVTAALQAKKQKLLGLEELEATVAAAIKNEKQENK